MANVTEKINSRSRNFFMDPPKVPTANALTGA